MPFNVESLKVFTFFQMTHVTLMNELSVMDKMGMRFPGFLI